MALANRVNISHSLINGRAVTGFDKRGKAAQEIQALFLWMEERLW